jgi:hypothetical protein
LKKCRQMYRIRSEPSTPYTPMNRIVPIKMPVNIANTSSIGMLTNVYKSKLFIKQLGSQRTRTLPIGEPADSQIPTR